MLLHRLIKGEPKMNEDKGMERDVQVMTPKVGDTGVLCIVPHSTWIKKGNISENIISNLF